MSGVLRANGGGIAHTSEVIENDASTGRFVGKGIQHLTDMQRRFVEEFVRNGANQTAAAKHAGYQDPGARAWELMRNSAVLLAIRQEQVRAIESGAPVAWGTMMELMTGENIPAPVRFSAAKWTLEASGHGLAAQALARKMEDPANKPMSEMTTAELEEHVKRMGSAVEALKMAEGRVIEVSNEDGSGADVGGNVKEA